VQSQDTIYESCNITCHEQIKRRRGLISCCRVPILGMQHLRGVGTCHACVLGDELSSSFGSRTGGLNLRPRRHAARPITQSCLSKRMRSGILMMRPEGPASAQRGMKKRSEKRSEKAMVPEISVAILVKKVTWHANMKTEEPSVVTPPATTVTPIWLSASVVLASRVEEMDSV